MKASTTLLAGALALAATATAAAQTAIDTKRIIASGLVYPTFITHAPGDASRLFVLEKAGRIRIVNLQTNTLLATSFLDIDALVSGGGSTSDEQGLLGLAFDPDYATNGQFYVHYTSTGANNVARYKVSANPNIANTTGVVLMTWSDPYTTHNGGWMDFGPDGNLYIATGDGGSANDPGNTAQTLSNRLGKMHRIKPVVGGASPYYTIPADNPFVGGATTADDTVWAYGLRNPWRCSFDRDTGDLWIGDVGQNAVEEVNFQAAGTGAGRNYGWRCTEGTSNTGLTGCTFGSPTLTAPIHVYNHVSGTSGGYCLTGGYVYRGCRIPDLQGTYFFADYSSANIWSFRYNAATNTKTEFQNRNSTLGTSIENAVVNQIASFGEDANGEIYIADHGGQIYKIIPASGDGPCAPPATPGDLNNDGAVNGADLGLLLNGWGACGTPCPGDLNADGQVNGADLGTLLANWTTT
jgi:glucose/arabinose dehydrogenase